MMDNTFKKGMSTISAADRQAAGSVQEGWLNCKTENKKAPDHIRWSGALCCNVLVKKTGRFTVPPQRQKRL